MVTLSSVEAEGLVEKLLERVRGRGETVQTISDDAWSLGDLSSRGKYKINVFTV